MSSETLVQSDVRSLSGELAFGAIGVAGLDDPRGFAARMLAGGKLDGSFKCSGLRVGSYCLAFVASTEQRCEAEVVQTSMSEGPVVLGVARIYDRSGLARRLGLELFQVETMTDIDLASSAYREWGIEFLDYLVGDFALLIVDQRRRSSYLVRDHLGTVPLYYFMQGDRLVFSTDLACLAGSGLAQCQLNERWLAMYQSGCFLSREETAYAGVFSVPPASYLEFWKGEPRLREYWSPRLEADEQAPGAEYWSAGLLDSLRAAVRDRYCPSFRQYYSGLMWLASLLASSQSNFERLAILSGLAQGLLGACFRCKREKEPILYFESFSH